MIKSKQLKTKHLGLPNKEMEHSKLFQILFICNLSWLKFQKCGKKDIHIVLSSYPKAKK